MSFFVRRASRIGGRNKFALAALAITGYLLFSKSGQERAATGVSVIGQIGETFDQTLRAFIPLDVFGEELGKFGEGFATFGTRTAEGVSGLFSPIRDFIEWIATLPSLTVKTTTVKRVVSEEDP